MGTGREKCGAVGKCGTGRKKCGAEEKSVWREWKKGGLENNLNAWVERIGRISVATYCDKNSSQSSSGGSFS